MRCVLWAALLWLGCSGERPPLQPPISDEEPIFDHSTFADARLERAVRQALRQPQGGLESEELSGLRTLDAGGYGIADVEGIERLRGLDTLMLGDNAVVDIGPLARLTQLQVLDLSNNQIADLAPLANLLLLKALNLDGNQVADLAPLARLTRLGLLNLDGNQVRDVSVLSRLQRLRSIELSGNPLDLDQVETLRGQGMERFTCLRVFEIEGDPARARDGGDIFLAGDFLPRRPNRAGGAQCGQEANRRADGGGSARDYPPETQQLGQVAGGH